MLSLQSINVALVDRTAPFAYETGKWRFQHLDIYTPALSDRERARKTLQLTKEQADRAKPSDAHR